MFDKLNYSPRPQEPQIEHWDAQRPPIDVVTLHTGTERITVEPGKVMVYTEVGRSRPSKSGDLRLIRRVSKKGSPERKLLDTNIPLWRRLTGRYAKYY